MSDLVPVERGRHALRGVEELTFDLMFEVLTPEGLAELVTPSLELAAAGEGNTNLAQQRMRAGTEIRDALHEVILRAGTEIRDALHEAIQAGTQVDAMANKSGREALRGAEVQMLDLIFEVLTSEQLAELLNVPLKLAATDGKRDLAQRLVRAGAQTGDALHKAVEGGHGEIVSDLLESGASVAAKDMQGFTPLHTAAFVGQTEMVQALLLRGADKNEFSTNEEWTPLCVAIFQGHAAAALALWAAGADINLRRSHLKARVVHVTALHGYVDILRSVIEHGADVEAVGQEQFTALHYAACSNKTGSIDALVGAGANIEARDSNGSTPLHHAGVKLCHEALLSLLKHGATVNAQNDSLQTPLMYAAPKAGTQGAAEVVDALLRAGADETIVDYEGDLASDVIGERVEEEDRLAEDIERVRQLLANAPADRAWRRRGYLVLCRAHPDRVQQNQMMISGIHLSDTGRKTRSRANLARAERKAGGSTVDERTRSDWDVVVAKVPLLQEEGIFRTIVGYL